MRALTFTEPNPARGPLAAASSSIEPEMPFGRVTNVQVSDRRESHNHS